MYFDVLVWPMSYLLTLSRQDLLAVPYCSFLYMPMDALRETKIAQLQAANSCFHKPPLADVDRESFINVKNI